MRATFCESLERLLKTPSWLLLGTSDASRKEMKTPCDAASCQPQIARRHGGHYRPIDTMKTLKKLQLDLTSRLFEHKFEELVVQAAPPKTLVVHIHFEAYVPLS